MEQQITLEQAEQFRSIMHDAGQKSDGCTFAPELGTPCCEMHDFLRRYRPYGISAEQADQLLRECIAKKGHPILAWVYWAGCRIMYKLGIFR